MCAVRIDWPRRSNAFMKADARVKISSVRRTQVDARALVFHHYADHLSTSKSLVTSAQHCFLSNICDLLWCIVMARMRSDDVVRFWPWHNASA